MGSKIEAKAMMRAAGVPVLPDSTVEGAADVGAVGYPMLVKASAGGGGRGMRIVRSAAELEQAKADAEREAATAFGDGTVFCERYVEHGRHVEIQVFADAHGNVVSLHERECSIQRRHQKIVEESPSPGMSTRHCAARWPTPPSPRPTPSATSAPARSSSCSAPVASSGSSR